MTPIGTADQERVSRHAPISLLPAVRGQRSRCSRNFEPTVLLSVRMARRLVTAVAIAAIAFLLQSTDVGATPPGDALSPTSQTVTRPHAYRLTSARSGYEALCADVAALMNEPTMQPTCIVPQACLVRSPIPADHPRFKQLSWKRLDVRENWQIVRALTCFHHRLCKSVALLEQSPQVVAYLSEVLEPARDEGKLILDTAAIVNRPGNPGGSGV